MGNDRFSKSLKVFLVFLALNLLAMNMGNVFINLFLMRISSDANSALMYNLVSAIIILASFFAIAPVSKKVNKKIGLIFGNVFSILLYLTIILLGDLAGDYAWILGMFSGIGQGFLWLSINVIMVDLTTYSNRTRYNGVNGIISSATQMISPLLASFIVGLGEGVEGYTYLFAFILSLMILSLIITTAIKVPKSKGNFSVKKALSVINRVKLLSLGNVLAKIFFREGIVIFVTSILIFEVTKSEGILAKIMAITTIISIGIYAIVPKLKLDLKKIYLIGTILSSISIVLLTVMFKSTEIIIIYAVIYGIANPMFFIPSGVASQNVTEEIDEAGDYRLEITCLRECFVGLGRISGIILLVILYNVSGDFSLLWVFGILAIVIAITSIRDINKIRM